MARASLASSLTGWSQLYRSDMVGLEFSVEGAGQRGRGIVPHDYRHNVRMVLSRNAQYPLPYTFQ